MRRPPRPQADDKIGATESGSAITRATIAPTATATATGAGVSSVSIHRSKAAASVQSRRKV
ncbi:MAG TPA: hypothetical protein QGH28_01595 [Chloroflexota bacterium]|nr:hypothetical protein [Chloroflexota bacterium]